MPNELEVRGAVKIVPDRLYYMSLRSPPTMTSGDHYFTIDDTLLYWNFFLDFGPLNLGQLYRFCQMLNGKLQDPKLQGKRIVFYSGTHPHRQANAACLITCWSVIYEKKTAEEAFRPFQNFYPAFVPFHDATPTACTYNLTILDVAKGMEKALRFGFFDFADFDADEYEYYEKVENGDFHWVGKKFIAFAGPHSESTVSPEGYCTHTPDTYIPYFLKHGVTMVVRLNQKYYDESIFTRAGIEHREMYFLDGSTPPNKILKNFLAEAEASPGVLAVHCKAGLGRTGSLIGSYLMKHYKFTAGEVIGWLRLCRPGMIIGPQQEFMEQVQEGMWLMGDEYRAQHNGCSAAEDRLAPTPPMYGKTTKPGAKIDLSLLSVPSVSTSHNRASQQVIQKNGLASPAKPKQPLLDFKLGTNAKEDEISQGDHLRAAKSTPKNKQVNGKQYLAQMISQLNVGGP